MSNYYTGTLLRTRDLGQWVELLSDEKLLQPDLLLAQPGIAKLLVVDRAARSVDDPELASAARLVRLAVAARGLAEEGAIGEGRLLAELALVAGLLSRERAQIVAQGLQEAALVLDTSRSRDAAVRNLAQSFASVESGANRQERPAEANVKPLKDPNSKWDKNTFTALLGNVETINGAKTPPDHIGPSLNRCAPSSTSRTARTPNSQAIARAVLGGARGPEGTSALGVAAAASTRSRTPRGTR
eukprot:scaffold16723_cov143-Isochrysis_galbana.AAC.2